MGIQRRFSAGKLGVEALNEDCIVETRDFQGVIDGASSEGAPLVEGVTVGRIVARWICDEFQTFDASQEVTKFVSLLTRTVAEKKAALNLYPYNRTGAAFFAVFNTVRREVWRLGDPWVVIDGKAHSSKLKAEVAFSQFRAVVLNSMIADGYKAHELESGVSDRDVNVIYDGAISKLANVYGSEFGYGVINGTEVATPFIEVINVPWRARALVIASDGYPEAPWEFEAAEQALASSLRRDPLQIGLAKGPKGIRPKACSFDDRSFVEINLAGGRARPTLRRVK